MQNLIADLKNPVLRGGVWNTQSPVSFFGNLITGAIGLVFVVGAVVFFFMLMIGAVQWISSGGDKAAVEAARGRISSALIGIIILFASYAVLKLVGILFGFDILTLDIGGLKL